MQHLVRNIIFVNIWKKKNFAGISGRDENELTK